MVMEEKEIWKDIEGYEGLYAISNLSQIKSYPRFGNHYKETILKHVLHDDGYLVVTLHKNGKKKQGKVHRLVAETFIPNPDKKPEVNHKNGIKIHSMETNLEWCTEKENAEHASKNGLLNPCKDANHGGARKVGKFIGEKLLKSYSCIKEVKDDNFSYAAVRNALSYGWKSGGYNWKYLDKEPINELICQA